MEVEILEAQNYMYMGKEPLIGPSYPMDGPSTSRMTQAPIIFIIAENSSTVIRRVITTTSLRERAIPIHYDDMPPLVRHVATSTEPDPEPEPSKSDAPDPAVEVEVVADEDSDDSVIIIAETCPRRRKKRRKLYDEPRPTRVYDDMNGQTCSICLDDWLRAGLHQVCCVKCGYLFGESCIRWWFMSAVDRFGHCPQCDARSIIYDIRPLFARTFRAVDTAERDWLMSHLEFVTDEDDDPLQETRHLHIFYRKYQRDNWCLRREMERIRGDDVGPIISSDNIIDDPPAEEILAPIEFEAIGEDDESPQFSLVHSFDVSRGGGSRVMASLPAYNVLTVSQRSKYSFFCGFGVKLIDTEEMKATQFIPAHQRSIKDMDFSQRSSIHKLLLTVSYDRTARLLDVLGTSNPITATITTKSPLWSCCWDTRNSHLMHVGSQDGDVTSYDIRNPARPLHSQPDPADKSPILSLTSVPPAFGRALPRGGLISCHASHCWVHDHGVREIRKVPLEGPFTSVYFDRTTHHFLFSAGSSATHPHARFTVSERAFRKADNDNKGPICDLPGQVFLGSSEMKVVSRPCIVPIENDLVVAAYQDSSSTVALWSVASGRRVSTIPSSDAVVDISCLKMNGENHIALLTEKLLRIFKYGDDE